MESVIATNVPTPTPDSDSSSFEKPTPTPAVLKNRLRLPTPTPAVLKTDSDSRLRLQLKTCDSTDSDSRLRLRLHNPARNLICPLGHCPTNTCSLLSGIPYSTWPSLPLYIQGSPWSRSREVEVRHLPPSVSRWGVKTGPECRGRALPFRHFWWHRVLFTMLNPSSDFPRGSLGITEEGSKYDAFPSTLSERRRSCLTRPAVLVLLLACGRFVTRASVHERPPFRPPPGPATRGFWLPPGVGFPPFLELTSLISSIILGKGVCHCSSRPPVVLDSVVRQRLGHLVLDGYHCLILSETLP